MLVLATAAISLGLKLRRGRVPRACSRRSRTSCDWCRRPASRERRARRGGTTRAGQCDLAACLVERARPCNCRSPRRWPWSAGRSSEGLAVGNVHQRLTGREPADLVRDHPAPRDSVSWVVPPMCGVRITLSSVPRGCARPPAAAGPRRARRRRSAQSSAPCRARPRPRESPAAVLTNSAPQHRRELLPGEEILILRGRPGVQRNEVRPGEKVRQAGRADAGAVDHGPINPGFVDEDRHAEGERPAGDPRPHLPESNQPQRLAAEISTEEPGPLERGTAQVAARRNEE